MKKIFNGLILILFAALVSCADEFKVGDAFLEKALTGKMVEDQDDCDISYTQKGTGGNLVIQTDSGNIRLKCR